MKPIMTKYCVVSEKDVKKNSIEKKFENYIEKKVKKIMDNPEKFSFFEVKVGEKDGKDRF